MKNGEKTRPRENFSFFFRFFIFLFFVFWFGIVRSKRVDEKKEEREIFKKKEYLRSIFTRWTKLKTALWNSRINEAGWKMFRSWPVAETCARGEIIPRVSPPISWGRIFERFLKRYFIPSYFIIPNGLYDLLRTLLNYQYGVIEIIHLKKINISRFNIF